MSIPFHATSQERPVARRKVDAALSLTATTSSRRELIAVSSGRVKKYAGPHPER
jgi:hypothetical protein